MRHGSLRRPRLDRAARAVQAVVLSAIVGGCAAVPTTSSSLDPAASGTSGLGSPTAAPAISGSNPSPGASGSEASPEATPAPGSQDLSLYALPQLDALIDGASVSAFASGPSGFVLLGDDRSSGGLLSVTSADGAAWVRHWLPGTTFGGGTPDRLIGGPFGYLALGWDPEPGSERRRLWSSADGVAWAPSTDDPMLRGQVTALTAMPWGAAIALDRGFEDVAVATTRNGIDWHSAAVPDGPIGNVYALVPIPAGVMILGTSASGASLGAVGLSAWRSTDGLTWSSEPQVADAIEHLDNSIDTWQLGPWGAAGAPNGIAEGWTIGDQGLTPIAAPPEAWGRLVGGPTGVLWVQGANAAATCAAAWRYDGVGWQPLGGTNIDRGCLDAAGPYVLGSASTPDAMVVVAMLGTSPDRVAWLVRAPASPPSGTAGGFDAGPIDPPVTAIPDALAAFVARPASCPVVPSTIGEILKIDSRTAVGCFRDTPMSFRAWVVDPGEGYGGTCPAFTPAWIVDCVLPDYQLTGSSPGTVEGTPTLDAMRAPTATGATKGVGRWVRVTGHYDDPISPSCRGVAGFAAVDFESHMPPSLAVLRCRLVFVVSDVRTVS